MIPISEKLIFMLRDQVAHEIGNKLQYLIVKSWAETQGLNNIAKYFGTQAEGEESHADILMNLLKDANSPLVIPTIEARQSEFADAEAVIRVYSETESDTTDRLEAISRVSDTEYNIGVQSVMQTLLLEQTEEEGSVDRLQRALQACGGNVAMLNLSMAT